MIHIEPFSYINDKFVLNNKYPIDNTIDKDYIHKFLLDNSFSKDTEHNDGEIYKKILVDIVAESTFHYPYPHITEKTIRPLYYKKMCIFLAPAGQLEILKSYGFLTFDDIIDESYDQIQDPVLRLIKVAEEVKKICNTDIDYLKEYYQDNYKKFNNNHNIVKNLKNFELKRIKKILNI